MKIWQIDVPYNSGFAELIDLYVAPTKILCRQCRKSVLPGLLVEWDIGSDVIGDFVSAGARVVAQERIADELLARFSGFRKRKIKMHDHANLRRPKRITKRTPRCVWLPYRGPKLVELQITKEIPLHDRSTVSVESSCSKCGRIIYDEFEGIEEWGAGGRVPREPGKGFFFKAKDVKGVDFFKPQHTGMTLVTDKVKRFIEKKAYSNVGFLEAGDTIR